MTLLPPAAQPYLGPPSQRAWDPGAPGASVFEASWRKWLAWAS